MLTLQYTPYILPLILAALTSAGLAFIIWQRRPGPGIVPFTLMMLGITEWTVAYIGELIIVDLPTTIFVSNWQYIGICTGLAAWLVFALQYTGHERWLTRRWLALLFIEPVLANLVLWMDTSFHLFYTSRVLLDVNGTLVLAVHYGIVFWLHAVYSYSLLLIGSVLFVRAFIRTPELYRGQITTLLIGAVAPWIANFISITGLSPFKGFDVTSIAFTVTGVTFAWSIARLRLMDIVPVARTRVFDTISDSVMVIDAQDRIVDINPAALRLLGRTSASAVLGQMPGAVLNVEQHLIDQFRPVEDVRTEVVLNQNSSPRTFQLQITPLRSTQGVLTGRVFVLNEITELKQAAEQIQRQNAALISTNNALAIAHAAAEESTRLKSEFLATMSHELRTPLNAIIGFTYIMLEGMLGPMTDPQNEYLGRVVANGERLLALINDILDLSKIEATQLDILKRPFAPAELLRNIDQRLHSLADKKSIRFETELDPALPQQLTGDEGRLEQILTNLIGNALRFTEAGYVRVRFEKLSDAQWTLTVSDSGIGMPPDALEYIFDEFRQVDGSSTRQRGGTGLGLAIVRKLTLLMDGSIRVQSELGKGSTFIVLLPLIVPPVILETSVTANIVNSVANAERA